MNIEINRLNLGGRRVKSIRWARGPTGSYKMAPLAVCTIGKVQLTFCVSLSSLLKHLKDFTENKINLNISLKYLHHYCSCDCKSHVVKGSVGIALQLSQWEWDRAVKSAISRILRGLTQSDLVTGNPLDASNNFWRFHHVFTDSNISLLKTLLK